MFTPRHGSWLHRAEPELSVLTQQALAPRRATQAAVHAQVAAWAEDRNAAQTGIDWQFRTEDALVCLKNLYPVAGQHGRARARERGGRAQKKGWIRPSVVAGAASVPRFTF